MFKSKYIPKSKSTQHLTAETARRVFNYDPETGLLTWAVDVGCKIKSGSEAGSLNTKGYRQVKYQYITYKAHRIAWLIWFGAFPENETDHINGIKTDNRIVNLRAVTTRENQCNQKRHRAGKLAGATKHGNKWKSYIYIKGKHKHLGMYDKEEQAHAAYIAAKARL